MDTGAAGRAGVGDVTESPTRGARPKPLLPVHLHVQAQAAVAPEAPQRFVQTAEVPSGLPPVTRRRGPLADSSREEEPPGHQGLNVRGEGRSAAALVTDRSL